MTFAVDWSLCVDCKTVLHLIDRSDKDEIDATDLVHSIELHEMINQKKQYCSDWN